MAIKIDRAIFLWYPKTITKNIMLQLTTQLNEQSDEKKKNKWRLGNK